MPYNALLQRTRGDAERWPLFAVAKGCFIAANPRDSKGLMVVHRGEGLLRCDEPERMLKHRPLFVIAKASFALANYFAVMKDAFAATKDAFIA